MAKSQLGTKRIDPETGRKFYDLNKDPIVSPYTGKTYPRSYFESGNDKVVEEEAEVEEKEVDSEDEAPEVISLEEADDDAKGDDLPEIEDEEDVDLGDDDEDTFLEEEEEEDDDVADIIGVGEDEDEVRDFRRPGILSGATRTQPLQAPAAIPKSWPK